MNIFSKKLILAAAAALVVFASGCVKKASRPTPEMTATHIGGSATQTPDYSTGPAYDSTNVPQFGTPVGGPTSVVDVQPVGHNEGTRDGNEIRNIPELQPIYFGFDRSAIDTKKEGSKFQAIKDYLAKNPGYKIIFEGHCDWRGTAEYNMALGDRRANSAKRYAVGVGIDANKIQVRSKGSTEATERGSDDVMAKDRRAEVVVLVK